MVTQDKHIFDVEILIHSLEITFIVFIMMAIIDWFDVKSKGKLHEWIMGHKIQQYFVTGLLGATPGCMGSYMNASLYMHGFISIGAIVGGFLATCGEASLVMFAQFPKTALILHLILFTSAIVFALTTDYIARIFKIQYCIECDLQEYHPDEASLTHYLKDHIWHHIIMKHIWKIFLWTFFALWFIHLGMVYLNLDRITGSYPMLVLLSAALIGLIPDVAPQFIFVALFSQGYIPFSVLLTSSLVQDGHGMLPLLSFSLKDSVIIKGFNMFYGLLIGLIAMFLGF